jgi:hypothetical protein
MSPTRSHCEIVGDPRGRIGECGIWDEDNYVVERWWHSKKLAVEVGGCYLVSGSGLVTLLEVETGNEETNQSRRPGLI